MKVLRILSVVVCSFLIGNAYSQEVRVNGRFNANSIQSQSINADSVQVKNINADSVRVKNINADSVHVKKINADSVHFKKIKADTIYINTIGSDTANFKAIGINNPNPLHNFHMIDGTMGFTSSIDNVTWVLGYNSSNDYLFMTEDVTPRLVVKRGGNVGIGTTAPGAKLDVNGSFKASSAVIGGKGIMINTAGSSALKYATKAVSGATGALAGFGVSSDIAITFSGVTYTTAPKVYAGNITSSSGTGDVYHVQIAVYDVTTTGCKVKLVNTSPNAVDLTIGFNIVSIGE